MNKYLGCRMCWKNMGVAPQKLKVTPQTAKIAPNFRKSHLKRSKSHHHPQNVDRFKNRPQPQIFAVHICSGGDACNDSFSDELGIYLHLHKNYYTIPAKAFSQLKPAVDVQTKGCLFL